MKKVRAVTSCMNGYLVVRYCRGSEITVASDMQGKGFLAHLTIWSHKLCSLRCKENKLQINTGVWCHQCCTFSDSLHSWTSPVTHSYTPAPGLKSLSKCYWNTCKIHTTFILFIIDWHWKHLRSRESFKPRTKAVCDRVWCVILCPSSRSKERYLYCCTSLLNCIHRCP